MSVFGIVAVVAVVIAAFAAVGRAAYEAGRARGRVEAMLQFIDDR